MGEKLDKAKQTVLQEQQTLREENQKRAVQAYEEGLQEGENQSEPYREKLETLKNLYASELSQDLLKAALSTAHELIEAELESSTESFLQFTQAALATIPDAQEVRIRVNPKTAPLLREQKASFVNLMQRAKDIDVREDKHIAQGLILQTESGVIDAQLKTQIEEIGRALGL
ncbi:MAG: hypothetical protein I8H75_05375 [Myxococcaceae bacterium]|nr:hypothetical protein [Myxococcaceae bacterium]MBH2006750.1 hypothetical protein [Myxococcaceae bacterium]